MSSTLDEAGLDLLFRSARTHNAWTAQPVPVELLHRLYDLMKMGPTSANSSPARILFATSPEAKRRLLPHVSQGNQAKTQSAPVTAIIGYDLEFYEKLPQLFPHAPAAKTWFNGDPVQAERMAFRNGSLQGAYLILAARALGLDTGGMSGFNAEGVEKEFFPDGKTRVNFLCNLGYGDPAGLFGRSPRLSFEEACQVI
jgi:3-hydroxypropanoate dehydrogenase